MPKLTDHDDIVEVQKLLKRSPERVVFFLGAGLSKPIGFPLWHELLHELVEFGQRIGRLDVQSVADAKQLITKGEFLLCGDLLRERLGTRVDRWLTDLFRHTSSHRGLYDFLVRLDCAGFVTTNYDSAIEDAFTHHFRRPIIAAIPGDRSLGSLPQQQPFLLKIHGDVTREKYTLSKKDYIEIEHQPSIGRLLYTLFYHYKIVFLGYGVSDTDILRPLELLASDFEGSTQRHVALLPETFASSVRYELEEKRNINVVGYDSSHGHGAVEEVVLSWFSSVALGRSDVSLLTPSDIPPLLHHDSLPVVHRMKDIALHAWSAVTSQHEYWGAYPGAPVKAAPIAEGLIAAKHARRVLQSEFDVAPVIRTLLSFRRSGMFVSTSLSTPNIQTHSLALYALALYQEHGREVTRALNSGVRWLKAAGSSLGYGWGRFVGADEIRVAPSVWAFAALLTLDAHDSKNWSEFRDKIIQQGVVGFQIGSKSLSDSTAGWLLWLLGLLKIRGLLEAQDRTLADLAISQLNIGTTNAFGTEIEVFSTKGARSEASITISWTHATAPIVLLGALYWSREGDAEGPLARALYSILTQAASTDDGFLQARTTERYPTDTIIPQTMYAVWALCECIQRYGGIVFEKSGLLVIRGKKLLLVRKRGTRELILVGGTVKPGENPEFAINREVIEELGVEAVAPKYWQTFADAAAFEPGATVRIHAYFGELTGTPHPNSEIAELRWVDSSVSRNELSPIIRNYVLPALIAAGYLGSET